MRRTIIMILPILVLAAATAWAVGEKATDFTLKDMKNADFRLGDYLGKHVIVMPFWMSWCKPCMVEMPLLETLYKKYRDKGLLVVSINADEPSGVARAKAIVRQKRVTYPVVFDSTSKITGIYNPNTQFPYTVIIDKKGKVAHVKTGFSAGDEKILEEQIQKLLEQAAE